MCYKLLIISFNPRTYIRYDCQMIFDKTVEFSFNPRTYIRYDLILFVIFVRHTVSIHVPI